MRTTNELSGSVKISTIRIQLGVKYTGYVVLVGNTLLIVLQWLKKWK